MIEIPMDITPKMNEIFTAKVLHGGVYYPDHIPGKVLLVVHCEDGDIYYVQLPKDYWRNLNE